MKRIRKSITIQDVAKAAGVSVSTVSRVLNDKEDVAVETLEKVRAVIEETGYVSSLAARGMRSHHTNVIGLVLPDVTSPYCVEVMQGVNRVIAQQNYDLLIYTNGDVQKYTTADQERYFVSLLNGTITDGVIVAAAATTNFSTDAPLVVIDPNIEESSFPSICSNNREGAMDAMKYLAGLGHRRIGHITGRLNLISARQRLQGFKDGLAACGLPYEEELVQEGDYSVENAVTCAYRLLAMKNPPTAIFAANDMTAMGVYQVAKEVGLRIPDDLSVVGFDDVYDASKLDPPLTTVNQSVKKMGMIATEMVLSLVRGGTLENTQVKVLTNLVVRESCCPLVCR